MTDYTFFDKDTNVTGELETNELILEGCFDGIINAKKKVILKNTAKINADIRTSKFMIEEGAIYNGKITLTGAQE
ncbi:MAG TPA: polymer-forming cytoskeletal protein [Balneolaceae bacterium]|nr:polymer-forming cytoskeletal protein [Balneolaceae bacterium]